MQFVVKRDILLESLNFVQGVVEKKNTLPILSNVLLELKNNKLKIVATDLDIIFNDAISDVKIIKEGSITTSAAILYDILRKISSNAELNFDLKTENKIVSHIAVLLTLIILIALIGMRLPKSIESGGLGLIRVIVMILTSSISMYSFIMSFINARRS